MKHEPLYRIRCTYPKSWAAGLDGGRHQSFIAEGRCEGSITGRFRGANYPGYSDDPLGGFTLPWTWQDR